MLVSLCCALRIIFLVCAFNKLPTCAAASVPVTLLHDTHRRLSAFVTIIASVSQTKWVVVLLVATASVVASLTSSRAFAAACPVRKLFAFGVLSCLFLFENARATWFQCRIWRRVSVSNCPEPTARRIITLSLSLSSFLLCRCLSMHLAPLPRFFFLLSLLSQNSPFFWNIP